MASVNYWIWLAERTKTQPEAPRLLLDHFGTPEGVYIAEAQRYEEVPRLTKKTKTQLVDKSLEDVEAILANCDRHNLRILTMADGDYPERLSQIEDPPAVLYVKGRMFRFDQEVAIGMVGARKPTQYGTMWAGRLAMELTRRGGLVVTGMAQGIDSAAVMGALRGGGPVVSVVAGGIDVAYPSSSRGLYADVASVGAILSEYPPGTPHEGWHFPIRNRIISGLSLGVLAVECEQRSGTMITIRRALEQDRDIFAVPGNIDAPMSQGPNSLIHQGAISVTSVEDILEEYAQRFPGKVRRRAPLSDQVAQERLSDLPDTPTKVAPAKPAPAQEPEGVSLYLDDPALGLTDDQKVILLALGNKKCLTDDLVEATQIPARRVLSALTLLQVKGYVGEEPGKRFQAKVAIRT